MKKQKKNKIPPFPLKLYDLVNNENNSHIITWTEDGLSFIIKDIHKFIYEILPKKFDTKLFSSFNRQLNSYGFTKTKSNQYEFSNQFFIKAKKNLLNKLKRKKGIEDSVESVNCMKSLNIIIQKLNKKLCKIKNNIKILEGKSEFLIFYYKDIMLKNYILQEEINKLNNNQKKLENVLFKFLSHLFPCINYFHRVFTNYLFLSFPNLREGEYDNKVLYLNQQFAKITGNALINNLFNNNNNYNFNNNNFNNYNNFINNNYNFNNNNICKEIKLEENYNLL